MEGLHAGLIRELVVTDGGSTDQTLQIAEEAGARIVSGAPSRGGQLRRGCEQAQGDWLLVLHADTVLETGWSTEVETQLQTGRPATFRLSFRAKGLGARWVAGWANIRTRLFGLPYGDQGLLVRKGLYDKVGGHPPQPLMEDVALARRLRGRLRGLGAEAVTSAERYRRDGWLRRGWRNLSTLALYGAGASPERLARRYER